MKGNTYKILFVLAVLAAFLYLTFKLFFQTYICVYGAHKQFHFLSKFRLCPPFLRIQPGEIQSQILSKTKLGDSKEIVEKALADLGYEYKLDVIRNRYSSILRHPDSDFHAILIYIYLDKYGKLERVEIINSFTSY